MPDWLLAALVTGGATGLVTWGAIKTDLRWHKATIDRHEADLDALWTAHFSCPYSKPPAPPKSRQNHRAAPTYPQA